MKKVNELNIKINKAVITKIMVELNPEKEEATWNVYGKLITDTGRSISDFGFSNDAWYNKDKEIQVPLAANFNGRALFEIFTPIVLEKLGSEFKKLPAKK